MPFSSHLFPIPRHGPDEAAMYGHPLEETVSALARCIASSPHPLAGALQQATHAEVWAHCRASDEAHQLHYDVGEIQACDRSGCVCCVRNGESCACACDQISGRGLVTRRQL